MEFRIHLGAHKTATTQFQDILEVVFSGQNEEVKYFSRAYLRQKKFVQYDIRSRSVLTMQLARFGHGWRREPLLQEMAQPYSDKARILVSEENILGSVDDLLNGFYPNAAEYLSSLKIILKAHPTKIYLSIRDYAEILPSAYCQSIRSGGNPNAFEFYDRKFSENDLGWPALVEEIVKVFPADDVVVWTFETYKKDPIAIAEMFAGQRIRFERELPRSERVTRLTIEQVEAIRKLFHGGRKKVGQEQIDRILSEHQAGTIYHPFTQREEERLTVRYHEDLDKIRSAGITVI